MAKIFRFRANKQLAAPSDAEDPAEVDPRNPKTTFEITLQTVDDRNQPAANVPVVIESIDAAGTLLYFSSDFYPIHETDDGQIHLQTSKVGEVTFFICCQTTILTTLLARIDEKGQSFRSLNLLFYDFGLTPSPVLSTPNVQGLNNGAVAIPSWDRLAYALRADTTLSSGAYRAAAIVCNDYALIGDPYIVSNDFRIPYSTLLTHGKLNRLAYVLRTNANTISSSVVSFTATGQGLVMPDPEKGGLYPAPAWENGYVAKLTSYDLWPDLVLNVPLTDDAQKGDRYDVHVYINGYDKTGAMKPPAPIQVYSLTAEPDATPTGKLRCTIPRERLLGYQRQSLTRWGYLWADCQITSAAWGYTSAWTRPWGPIQIDFFE